MSVPTGLFIDSPEMNDVSLIRLSNESDVWPEEVVQKVKERIPKAASLNMMVKWMKKDDESGTATGSVVINSSEKSAIVPVIIKEFMMSPLDLMIADQKMLPLTPDYFESVFLDNNLFQKLEEYPIYAGMGRFDNYATQLNDAIYPPNMGRYSYAKGEYSILEDIASTIDPAEFKNYLRENPRVLAQFHKTSNEKIIQQISKLQPVNLGEYESAARDLIPRSVLMVKKMGYDNYSILANSDQVFDPRIMKKLRRCDCLELLGTVSAQPDDLINDVDRNGEKILYPEPQSGNDPYLFEPQIAKAVMCEDYNFYQLKKMNGVTVEGWVVPKVINFDMDVQPMKLFIGKTMSTMQPEFSGVKATAKTRINSCAPEIGMTGTFIYEKEKNAIGTVPVTIVSMAQEGGMGAAVMMKVQDLNGRRFDIKFHLGEGNNHLQQIVGMDNGMGNGSNKMTYLMPAGFKFCPMEGFYELTSSTADFHVKTAAEKLTPNPATIIPTGYGYYSVKGVDKYAAAIGYDKTNMPEYSVKFLMTSLGVNPENFDNILKTANVRGKAEVHGISRTPLLREKIASGRPLAKRMTKVANLLKSNLIKEASLIDNKQTVDSLLSLNFVNPENLSKFIGYLPQFKATISALGACLLGSRLGVQEIPEQATSTAMYRIIDVVNGLERLRAIQEHGEK